MKKYNKEMQIEWMEAFDSIIDICKEYHVDRVVLFGSRARGTNTRVSDIDIVIKYSIVGC